MTDFVHRTCGMVLSSALAPPELKQAEGSLERPLAATRPSFGKGRGGWRDELSPVLARKIIGAHQETMRRLGYLDGNDEPVY